MFLSGRKIFLITVTAAAAVRIAAMISFSGSFFDSYHLVPGLDMQTLLHFSEWGSENCAGIFFTFHRLMIFLDWHSGGGQHCVWTIFIVQSLMGILGAACIADLILKLTRARKIALCGGILSALYMPFLVYELSILQETFMVNFALFALWSMFYALHKRFEWKSSLLLAFTIFAALAGRPAALFMCGGIIIFCAYKMFKRKMLKRTLFPAVLLLLLLSGASAFNAVNGQPFSPFYNVMPYTLQYNAAPDTPQQPATIFHAAANAAKRVPRLFKYGELPENQNIYFWCRKMPFFDLLPGPGVLLPCAGAGIMILLLSGAWKKRYGLILAVIASLALPLCAREAIGRYRLMLIPAFFIVSGCAAAVLMQIKERKRRTVVICGALLGASFTVYGGSVPEKIRLADHASYAIAAVNTPGTPEPEIIMQHRIYWESSLFSSSSAFTMYAERVLMQRRFEQYFMLADEALLHGKINPDLVHYFAAVSSAMQNQPLKVEFYLRKIRNVYSLPPEMTENAFFLRDKTIAILEKMKK